jgi:hypothetical protein
LDQGNVKAGVVSLPRKREAENDLDNEEEVPEVIKPEKKRKRKN